MKVPFNKPLLLGSEKECVNDLFASGSFSSQGPYTQKTEALLNKLIYPSKVLLTSSCTHSLEMCALLLDIAPGDEIIMASYNFVSAANAFVLRGAKIVFVDIKVETLNIDENLIEEAITQKTKAILVMHYGGVPCNMERIMEISDKHNLFVIEDAAHCIGSYHDGKHLGSIGHLGAISFHSTKNIHCGEGGALLINDQQFFEKAEIIRDKGTNRKNFIKGEVDKYTWVSVGSSYSLSELSASFLYAQLKHLDEITRRRLDLCKIYEEGLNSNPFFSISEQRGNGHIFYILCQTEALKNQISEYLSSHGIVANFHYLPLHVSEGGRQFSRSSGDLDVTESISNRILRLPLFYEMTIEEQAYVIATLNGFK